MSGSGRKSSYRKSVTDGFSNSYPLPSSFDEIVRIKCCRGANIFEVETHHGIVDLALLPNKFKKLIWIKRDDFVLIETNEQVATELPQAQSSSTGKVKYMIKSILNKDQIKHIKANNLWPAEFEVSLAKIDVIVSNSSNDLMPGYDSEEYFEEVEEDEDVIDVKVDTIAT